VKQPSPNIPFALGHLGQNSYHMEYGGGFMLARANGVNLFSPPEDYLRQSQKLHQLKDRAVSTSVYG
jgi:hypothetical protein